MIAFDQIDTLVAQSGGSAIAAAGALDAAAASMLGQVTNGLMALRELTRRALIVVACLPDTWKIIRREAVGSVPDRFREAPFMGRVSNAKVGMAIVRKRLEGRYGDVGFRPPYPTWPIRELAFAEAAHFTPRALLKRVERHALDCLRRDTVVELEQLEDDGLAYAPDDRIVVAEGSTPNELDARFASLVKQADIEDALHRTTEDARMPALLAAGLRALIVELGDPAYKHDPVPSTKPPLHARLRLTLDERIEDEEHWAFRAISSNHPGAVMSRVTSASTMAGLDPTVPKRRLFLLRNERMADRAEDDRDDQHLPLPGRADASDHPRRPAHVRGPAHHAVRTGRWPGGVARHPEAGELHRAVPGGAGPTAVSGRPGGPTADTATAAALLRFR